jgi:hypothetical protein
MRDLADIERLIDSGTALIFVETSDAARLEELASRLATRTGKPAWRWALATGLTRLGPGGLPQRGAGKPADLLAQVLATPEPALWLLHDLARYLGEPLIVSQLREIAARARATAHSLLVPGCAASRRASTSRCRRARSSRSSCTKRRKRTASASAAVSRRRRPRSRR